MRLEDLYFSFNKASPEVQAQHIASYRLNRAKDMTLPCTWPKPKKKGKAKAKILPLTEEEKVLMSLLGLKKKEIIGMRKIKKA